MSESQVCECQDHRHVSSVVAMNGLCPEGIMINLCVRKGYIDVNEIDHPL